VNVVGKASLLIRDSRALFHGRDDQKVVNLAQILFATERMVGLGEAPAQGGRTSDLAFRTITSAFWARASNGKRSVSEALSIPGN
jgi:hypothetical protein